MIFSRFMWPKTQNSISQSRLLSINHFLFLSWIFSFTCLVASLPRVSEATELKSSRTMNGSLFDDLNDESGISGYVKFSMFLNEQGNPFDIVFQNSKKFPFHADYLITRPEFSGWSRSSFDGITLRQNRRKILLGTIEVPKALRGNFEPKLPSQLHFDFISQDPLPVALVSSAHDLLRSRIPLVELIYAPKGKLREEALRQQQDLQRKGVEIFTKDDVQDVVVYNAGWNVGRVVKIKSDDLPHALSSGDISSGDILVMDRAPREIPPIAGLIVDEPTPPSSHVALLSKMYGIPFMRIANAMSRPELQDVIGRSVFMSVHSPEPYDKLTSILFFSKELSQAERNRLLAVRTKKTTTQPRLNKLLDSPRLVADLNEQMIGAYGSKAVKLGLLQRVIPKNVPQPAVGLPIYFFDRFVNDARLKNGESLRSYIRSRLDLVERPDASLSEIARLSKEIQLAFREANIGKEFWKNIESQLGQFFRSPVRLKFRSSSNAEDLSDFNGAGLYDSYAGWLGSIPPDRMDESKKTTELALRKVWASLYSARGLMARREFGILNASVGMGVLVQPSIKDELANGVAILTPDQYGVTIEMSGFPGEDLQVTNPVDGKVPEVVRISDPNANRKYRNIQLVSASSELPTGRRLMSDEDYDKFVDLMRTVQAAWPNPRQSLDFEWKTIELAPGKRQMILKQVRAVPHAQTTKDDSSVLFVGQSPLELESSGHLEVPDAVRRLLGPQKLQIHWGVFSIGELVTGKNPVSKVVVSDNNGDHEIEKPKHMISDSGWILSNTDPDFETRKLSIEISVPTRNIPSLSIAIPILLKREKISKQLTSAVLTSHSLRPIFASATELPGALLECTENSKTYCPEHGKYPLSWMFQIRSSDEIDLGSMKQHAIVRSEDAKSNLRIEFHQRGVFSGGTFDLSGGGRAVISGLLDRPLLLEGQSIAFAASHHNFIDQWAVDLFQAKDITQKERDLLDKMKIRFLIINGGLDESYPHILAATDFRYPPKMLMRAGIEIERRDLVHQNMNGD